MKSFITFYNPQHIRQIGISDYKLILAVHFMQELDLQAFQSSGLLSELERPLLLRVSKKCELTLSSSTILHTLLPPPFIPFPPTSNIN